jgi:hypothetical protein
MSTFLLATLNSDDGDAMVLQWGSGEGPAPIFPPLRGDSERKKLKMLDDSIHYGETHYL